MALTEKPDGSIVLKQGDGREEFYDPLGGGNFKSRFAGVFSVLVKNLDGSFVLTLKNQTQYRFNAAKKLTSIVDRNGNTLSSLTVPPGQGYSFKAIEGKDAQLSVRIGAETLFVLELRLGGPRGLRLAFKDRLGRVVGRVPFPDESGGP